MTSHPAVSTIPNPAGDAGPDAGPGRAAAPSGARSRPGAPSGRDVPASTSVFHRLGTAVARRARLVLVVAGLAVAVSALLGVGVFGRLLGDGFDDPASASSRASVLVDQHFGGEPDMVFLVHARVGTVDSPAAVAAGTALAGRLAADPRLTGVTSYWTGRPAGLRSKDATDALVLARVAPDAGSAALLTADGHVDTPAVTVRIGGAEGTDVGGQVGRDVALAETIAVPITLVLLILAFGSLVAALLPFGVALVAIFGTFAVLDLFTHVTSVSVFALNLTTALGLGLGIDHALLMVSRFREELGRGVDVDEAVARTNATAGRTIAFSAVTVAVALSALLAVLGHRVNAGRVPGVGAVRAVEAPFWGRLARGVMRRPVAAVPVVAVLLLLATPLLTVTFGSPDDRVLPTGAASHQVGDALRTGFATAPAVIDVLVEGRPTAAALTGYARTLSTRPGVQRADTADGAFAAGRPAAGGGDPAALSAAGLQRITLSSGLDSASGPGQDLVREVRAATAPAGTTVLVGGATAELVDARHAIGSHLLEAAVIIVLTTFVLLFLFTGSVVQPVRALLGNALTLGATLGVMVWIFQQGHLSRLLHFTPTPTDTSMPVLLFCIAFGLSMDYEVFLMSRITELHDGGDTTADAVAHGLARTGRIVITAAGLAILIDATLVRGLLVPAAFGALGDRSWYAPRALRRLHARVGLYEAGSRR